MTYKTKLAIGVAIFLWASAFVGIRAGLTSYSPEGLALLRYLVASLCMGIVYFRLPAAKKTKVTLPDLCGLIFLGIFGIGIYNITLNHSEVSISSGMTCFIISQSPLITAMIAVAFFGEKMTITRVIGFVFSVIGIFCISVGEMGGFKWDDSITYILVATVASGCYSIMQKPFLKKYHIISATTFVIWGGTLFLLLYLPQLKADIQVASLSSTLMVIYLGIFPAAIGYLAWSYVLANIPSAQAVSFLYFTPLIATILGWWVLGEVPVLLSLLGGVLAIFGVWIVNHSYKKIESAF